MDRNTSDVNVNHCVHPQTLTHLLYTLIIRTDTYFNSLILLLLPLNVTVTLIRLTTVNGKRSDKYNVK